MQVTSLYDAAMLIGKTLQEVIQRDSSNQQNCGNTNFNCNLLLGGRSPETHRLFISTRKATLSKPRDTPYFQIGEQIRQADHRPGVTIDTPLEQAMCCALISIDSTLRSNLSVGLPLDTLLYRSGPEQRRTASDHRKRSLFQYHSQCVVRGAAKHLSQAAAVYAGRPESGGNNAPASCRSWCGKVDKALSLAKSSACAVSVMRSPVASISTAFINRHCCRHCW